MGTIVCQDCQEVIEHFDDEKVSTLYGTCTNCCDN
ncbi:GapA-binding peptide SR1P [Lentibacillus cibarius]|uniref:GapA-binding peptide SR1P n=1 Tax=Lentibacillus cibarius TaxID=2583219 RepID=A0A549YK55_9BACI|nr:GapA-binding peptide SR1P [Lentibacillus cibarius]TRM12262.1 GapA-binding peptide SR1P [Lentibacillus cibarius]